MGYRLGHGPQGSVARVAPHPIIQPRQLARPWVAVRDQLGLQSRAAAFNSSATCHRSRYGHASVAQRQSIQHAVFHPSPGIGPTRDRYLHQGTGAGFESWPEAPRPLRRRPTGGPRFEAADRGSIHCDPPCAARRGPGAGTSSSVAKRKGARLLTGRAQVRVLPLEPRRQEARHAAGHPLDTSPVRLRPRPPRSPRSLATIAMPRSSSGRMAGFQSVDAGSSPVRGTDLLWV